MGRKRTLVLALVAVLLIAAGGWAWALYVRGPESILQRAEAWALRRMQATRLGPQPGYRFHYATNRSPGPDPDSIDQRFGRERSAGLTFGEFDTHIEPTLGIGMLLDRSDWLRDEEIQLDRVANVERDALIAGLRTQVAASSNGSLLVLVNGFREEFPSALRKTAFVAHVLDIDTPFLVFDWPGDQGSSLQGYRRAREVADASGRDLADVLELLVREVEPERLWIVANSMGAEVVARAFAALYEREGFDDAEAEIEDVVLTAPDVDRSEFDGRFQQEMAALARDLTVYVSSNDRALIVSRVINREKRLGESTLDAGQLDEAVAFSEWLDDGGDRLAIVDVTPINRTRNFHNFSLETPEFFDDLYLRLTNEQTPRSRHLYGVTGPEGRVYWVLRPTP